MGVSSRADFGSCGFGRFVVYCSVVRLNVLIDSHEWFCRFGCAGTKSGRLDRMLRVVVWFSNGIGGGYAM